MQRILLFEGSQGYTVGTSGTFRTVSETEFSELCTELWEVASCLWWKESTCLRDSKAG
jgi:hypothetical protein